MKTRPQLHAEAIDSRRSFGKDAYAPLDMLNLLLGMEDLTVIFYPMSDSLSGMCIRDGGNQIIAINSNMPLGRQNYTMAHEFYHLRYHENFTNVLCPANFSSKKDVKEKEADQFATYFLAPPEALREFIANNLNKELGQELFLQDVIRIEQNFKMSHQAILWRLANEGYLKPEERERMDSGVRSAALRLGFDAALYLPSPANKRYLTLGNYINLATGLFEKDLVSKGKYEELLLDAFRDDLVYGEEEIKDDYDKRADLF